MFDEIRRLERKYTLNSYPYADRAEAQEKLRQLGAAFAAANPVPPPEPTPAPAPEPTPEPKKSLKPLIIGIIIALLAYQVFKSKPLLD